MKKSLFIIVILSFTVFQGWTQADKTNQISIEPRIVETTGFYLKGDLGVAFGTHPEMYTQTTSTTGSETSNTVFDAIKVRFGTGLPVEVAAGYMINKNFGVELGVDYFHGFNTKIVNSVNGDQSKTLLSAVHLSIIPSVVAKFGTGKVTPYIEMGIDVSMINHQN